MALTMEKYLKAIEGVFDVEKLLGEKQDRSAVRKYYLSTHLGYLILHSPDGFMHMGISHGPTFRKADLVEPANIVDSYIRKTPQVKILELAPGNGSNSSYLAGKHKNTQFYGIDLSKRPLRRHSKITNYRQEIGDYHDLNRYEDRSFDLAFVVEALCHTQNKEKVLSEVYKKLRNGGYFLIFDGYQRRKNGQLTDVEMKAKRLVEVSMAVESFEEIEAFRDKLKDSGFRLIEEKDLSENVLPSMERLKNIAHVYYRFPAVARLFKALLPARITQNSIGVLLLPDVVRSNIGCYYLHVLQKPA